MKPCDGGSRLGRRNGDNDICAVVVLGDVCPNLHNQLDLMGGYELKKRKNSERGAKVRRDSVVHYLDQTLKRTGNDKRTVNSPSGGSSERVFSLSKFSAFTHSWKLQSSISTLP